MPILPLVFAGSKYLSPDYFAVLLPGENVTRTKYNLVEALSKVDDMTRARMLGAAFRAEPGATILGGIAVVHTARSYSRHLALTDHLKAAAVADFAEAHELQVAGCIRTLYSEEAVNAFMNSKNGAKALAKAVSYQCYEIVCVPQVQICLECQFHGLGSFAELEDRSKTTAKMMSLARSILKVVLLPLIAVYPPLAERRTILHFAPAMRYYLHEWMAVMFFFVVFFSDLSIHRAQPFGLRDWGLLGWSSMMIFSQCQFVFFGGVLNFFADVNNLVDLIANLAAFTAFLLGVCHGQDQFLSSTFPAQCDSWPQTVPIAAWEAMSIAMLLHGFRASRILTLHPVFGPLMLSVMYMAVDMVRWVLIVIFPLMGFAAALKMLYGESYKDGSLHQVACNPLVAGCSWSQLTRGNATCWPCALILHMRREMT